MTLLLLAACSDITSIDDGQQVGDVVVLKDWFTSVQLLNAGERVILFDGGFRDGKVERQLESQGLGLADITDVFLTHGHSDHLGIVPELPNATVYAFAEELELIEEESKGEVTVDTPLTHGQVFTLGSATVEAYHVPGHTDGSAVFLAGGALILGDSVQQNRAGELVVNDGRFSEDVEAVRTNLRALADELEPRADSIQWLVPAHTAPLAGFGALRAL